MGVRSPLLSYTLPTPSPVLPTAKSGTDRGYICPSTICTSWWRKAFICGMPWLSHVLTWDGGA
eukprot:3941406-Rhodomonas_salina.3